MMNYIAVFIIALSVTGCTVKDEGYYLENPKALQAALADCPMRPGANVSCQTLEAMNSRLQKLASQLRESPQAYGQRILALQEIIARQQSSLEQNDNQPELRSTLLENKRALQLHLAVVKWLESPER